jgi:hypothetical protein
MSISCSQCGSSFPDEFNFCLTCGKRLKEVTSPLPPPSAADAARAGAGAQVWSGLYAPVQQRPPTALSMVEDDPKLVTRVIDPGEYSPLLERVQALRQEVAGLAQPADFDPRSFFAVFDRVKLLPWYVPDFVFFPSRPGGYFGEKMPGEMDGIFHLYTRLALLPRRYPRRLKPSSPFLSQTGMPQVWGYERPPGLPGLVMGWSVSSLLQFALLHLEVQVWREIAVPQWQHNPGWQWVCSRQRLEAIVAALDAPSSTVSTPQPMLESGLSEQQRLWLRRVDPRLRARRHSKQVWVGGLAYSRWHGFAWLECELTWPTRFEISRLDKLGIARSRWGVVGLE